MNREPHFGKFALTTLLPFAERFPIQYILGKKNCRIAYRFFEHQQTSQRQLLILVNGRASNLLKWTEVAYDFYQQGFDVLAFDHRGQGYSQRLLSNTYKGHIDHFEYYLDDLDAVAYREDACMITEEYGAENIAILRRLALNLSRLHPLKQSMRGKLKRANWCNQFREELLFGVGK